MLKERTTSCQNEPPGSLDDAKVRWPGRFTCPQWNSVISNFADAVQSEQSNQQGINRRWWRWCILEHHYPLMNWHGISTLPPCLMFVSSSFCDLQIQKMLLQKRNCDRANLVFAKLFGLQNSFSVFVRVFLFGIRLGADFDLVGTQKVG